MLEIIVGLPGPEQGEDLVVVPGDSAQTNRVKAIPFDGLKDGGIHFCSSDDREAYGLGKAAIAGPRSLINLPGADDEEPNDRLQLRRRRAERLCSPIQTLRFDAVTAQVFDRDIEAVTAEILAEITCDIRQLHSDPKGGSSGLPSATTDPENGCQGEADCTADLIAVPVQLATRTDLARGEIGQYALGQLRSVGRGDTVLPIESRDGMPEGWLWRSVYEVVLCPQEPLFEECFRRSPVYYVRIGKIVEVAEKGIDGAYVAPDANRKEATSEPKTPTVSRQHLLTPCGVRMWYRDAAVQTKFCYTTLAHAW